MSASDAATLWPDGTHRRPSRLHSAARPKPQGKDGKGKSKGKKLAVGGSRMNMLTSADRPPHGLGLSACRDVRRLSRQIFLTFDRIFLLSISVSCLVREFTSFTPRCVLPCRHRTNRAHFVQTDTAVRNDGAQALLQQTGGCMPESIRHMYVHSSREL